MTAKEKIRALVEVTIVYPESLQDLPVVLVRALADDTLDAAAEQELRDAWAALESKSLLSFLRAYAISTTFHSPHRVKFWSSIERHLMAVNRLTLNRTRAYLGYYDPLGQNGPEGLAIFRPMRNVFGDQPGLDAVGSGEVFRVAYGFAIERVWFYSRTCCGGSCGMCTATSDEEVITWRKDWAKVIPTAEDGTYRVKAVSEWLWQRFIADNLRNFGPLERVIGAPVAGGCTGTCSRPARTPATSSPAQTSRASSRSSPASQTGWSQASAPTSSPTAKTHRSRTGLTWTTCWLSDWS